MRSPRFRAFRPSRARGAPDFRARLAVLLFLALLFSACTQSSSNDGAASGNGLTVKDLDASGSFAQSDEDDEELKQQAQTAFPAGKYVSVSGNNGNGGTSPTDAWRNLSHAVKQLRPGDTLWVMDGTYEESERGDAAVVVNQTGRADAWIRITAFPGASPVIRSHHKNGMKIEGASYVEVSNLEFHGTYNEGDGSYSGSGINSDSIYISSGTPKNHHIRILNNKVHGYGAGGIPITGSSHVEIRNNVVYALARYEWSQHSGISILESFNMGFGNDANGYSNYITGNIVYQVENVVRDRGGRLTDGNCIIMDRTNINGYTGRTLIANNICIDNGGRAIQIFESAHADVVNNTTYHNLRTPEIGSSGGELGAFYSHDVVFANNLVHAANGKKPARAFDSSNIRFENNVYVADTGPDYGGAGNTGEQRVAPGTQVVKSAGTSATPSNWDLVSGSVAVNAGTNRFVGALRTDIAGRARQSGGAVDVGAFESGASTPASTTTSPPPPPPSTTPAPKPAPTTAAPKPPPTTAAPTAPPTTAGTSAAPTSAKPTTVPGSTRPPTVPVVTVPTTLIPDAPSSSGPTTIVRPPTTLPTNGNSPTTTNSDDDRSALPTSVASVPPSPSTVAARDTGQAPAATAPSSTVVSTQIGAGTVTAAEPQPSTTGQGVEMRVIPSGQASGPTPNTGSGAAIEKPTVRASSKSATGSQDAAVADTDTANPADPTDSDESAPEELAFVDDRGAGDSPSPLLPLASVFLVSMMGAWQFTRPTRGEW